MVGCAASSTDKPNPPSVEPTEGNVVTCTHKYSAERNFQYTPPMKSETREMFGETVTTFQFTTINGEKRFLSMDEFENYKCE